MKTTANEDVSQSNASLAVSGFFDEDEDGDTTKEEREEIAKDENRLIGGIRLLVVVVLVASALAVSISVYRYMSGSEEEAFETKFESDADKVLEAMGKTLDQTVGATDAFIRQIVSHARHSNSTWPFVTMPDYGLHAGKLLKLSKDFTCSICVFVEPDQREDWLEYANDNLHWVDEAKAIQDKDPDWTKSQDFVNTINYDLWGFDGPGRINITEPTHYKNNFLPYWQQYPMVKEREDAISVINHDVWQAPSTAVAVLDAVQNQRVVVAPVANIAEDSADELTLYIADIIRNWAKQYISEEDDSREPIGGMWYPMYDSLESIHLNLTKDQQPVGVFYAGFFWRELIRDILPSGSNGIILVYSDGCGPTFTYQLNGPNTIFLGAGDLHDSKYDAMGRSLTLFEIMDATKKQDNEEGYATKSKSSYSGLPLSETFCPGNIYVYPSQTMEDDYVTNQPLLFTLACVAIFVFTSAVFITYDLLVARRQRIVMERALASGAIVSSLFPEKVKQQLYAEQKQEKQPKKEMTIKGLFDDAEHGMAVESSKPIADLFENTTIFFADLAGFTAWSANRTPSEVFVLLETLYGAFDKIADRRKVFKVETIGDCYVAVTGIPEPQQNHAVIMARFARDCLTETNQIARELADTMGEDTRDLEMRVGLHSGSTTAGVLRGKKGRFQLFGDTVNTASRMESTGVKGRIHVSQATADALIACGKESWVSPRPDKIVAKGKGEMQTYFIQIATGSEVSRVTKLSDSSGEPELDVPSRQRRDAHPGASSLEEDDNVSV
ncbi:Receptor-type guanylate cyclase gcy [Seminavis robusta]|uniref:Receptor-type guanylate cyclase gcy n=1 Tax=Seminavis robusta TaxID=568900 RepID=A0A9N8DYS2_9STRA|nr:Receptor-type guanylate cyclase gcy [Seminavis robusta]|eukprot:Sro478_g150990.1 Receptor-type guanylate cyclase gcy (781) ;mRNA; f:17395-20538